MPVYMKYLSDFANNYEIGSALAEINEGRIIYDIPYSALSLPPQDPRRISAIRDINRIIAREESMVELGRFLESNSLSAKILKLEKKK